jgi:hypothetical protein
MEKARNEEGRVPIMLHRSSLASISGGRSALVSQEVPVVSESFAGRTGGCDSTAAIISYLIHEIYRFWGVRACLRGPDPGGRSGAAGASDEARVFSLLNLSELKW